MICARLKPAACAVFFHAQQTARLEGIEAGAQGFVQVAGFDPVVQVAECEHAVDTTAWGQHAVDAAARRIDGDGAPR